MQQYKTGNYFTNLLRFRSQKSPFAALCSTLASCASSSSGVVSAPVSDTRLPLLGLRNAKDTRDGCFRCPDTASPSWDESFSSVLSASSVLLSNVWPEAAFVILVLFPTPNLAAAKLGRVNFGFFIFFFDI